ncbi:MAG TPA: N-acetyl sugar amidotransferase [Bacteroidia bacterium]|nr:N-acetyl sugar amidotransferase [Bacteroidia bacterium]HRH09488.1 N-acetyl sugar amidotransferase [Bacteroidia bacterium]HRH62954.1 N-acetyl sugar amidotransferase [Bacteroidia bacterium]
MSDKKYKIAPDRPAKMRYCKQCVYPASSAVPLAFGDDGICSGCRSASQRVDIDWDRRKKMFERLIEDYRCKDGSNYDCIIPVSGGKDSYFQIHIIKKVYGLNPLLVTYHGNNYTPTGMKNLLNMREAFDADHVFFTPSIDVLKAMNRLGMQIMGDMNWHAHAGIFTYPIRVAVQQNVPLMIWGEHGFMDLGGMHSYNDLVEFTYRYRHEHCMRGYEWYDILEKAESYGEKLEKKQLIPWMYPSDEEIERVGVRGIYISNFFKWEANEHGKLMQEKYGFLPAEEPFERTYRTTSNLDDMHENGIHDYMKYIKFGYGRATDHVCKDIRAGILNRDAAIEIVRKMDPIKSKDLQRWLTYVDWTEEKFDAVADSFRDPRVWWKTQDGQWQKDNLWDEK